MACAKRNTALGEPVGYSPWHDWARKMSKTHDQLKCSKCGIFHIWRRKAKRLAPALACIAALVLLTGCGRTYIPVKELPKDSESCSATCIEEADVYGTFVKGKCYCPNHSPYARVHYVEVVASNDSGIHASTNTVFTCGGDDPCFVGVGLSSSVPEPYFSRDPW